MGVMNSGVKQWVFQRISNALIVTFGVALIFVLLSGDGFTYESLTQLVTSSGFKYYLIVVLLFACANSLLAAWQIEGDYAKKFGLPGMMISIVALVVSIAYLIYGLKLLLS